MAWCDFSYMIPTCYNQSFNCGRYDTKYMAKAANVKEWDLLWQEYTKSLENWKKMFEQAQEANNEMQARFNDVIRTQNIRTVNSKEASLEQIFIKRTGKTLA